MDEETRELLTEYLGECPCSNKDAEYCAYHCEFRTFTTPDDFFALKDKLVEKGDWRLFYDFCYLTVDMGVPYVWDFFDWLINPPRFCELVGEWLKARG